MTATTTTTITNRSQADLGFGGKAVACPLQKWNAVEDAIGAAVSHADPHQALELHLGIWLRPARALLVALFRALPVGRICFHKAVVSRLCKNQQGTAYQRSPTGGHAVPAHKNNHLQQPTTAHNNPQQASKKRKKRGGLVPENGPPMLASESSTAAWTSGSSQVATSCVASTRASPRRLSRISRGRSTVSCTSQASCSACNQSAGNGPVSPSSTPSKAVEASRSTQPQSAKNPKKLL